MLWMGILLTSLGLAITLTWIAASNVASNNRVLAPESRVVGTSMGPDGTQHLDTFQMRPSSKHTYLMDAKLLPCWLGLHGKYSNMDIVAGLIGDEDREAYRDGFIEVLHTCQRLVELGGTRSFSHASLPQTVAEN